MNMVHNTTQKSPISWHKRGFTLVEIFLGLGLIATISLLVVTVFYAHFKIYSSQATTIDISSQNQIALAEITNQIRESQLVLSPTSLAFDKVSSTISTGSTSTLTWSHTISAGTQNRMLVVGVAFKPPLLGGTVSTIKYNNVPLTKIGNQNNGNNVRVEIWYLLAPDTGTNNIDLTLNASVPKIVTGATSWTGVNQTTPLGTFQSDWNINTPATVNVVSSTGEIVLDTVGYDRDRQIIAAVGQTEQWNKTTTNGGIFPEVRGASSTKPGEPTTTMSWTLDPYYPNQWAIGAVPIKSASSQPPDPAVCNGELSTGQVLVLRLWPIDASGQPLDPGSTNYDCIIYRRNGAESTVVKTIIPSPISSRQFTYYPDTASARSITITVTTTGTADSKTTSFTQSAKAVLRNK
jgi:hypothetical protein